MNSPEYVTAIVSGLTVGAPVAMVTLRHLAQIVKIALRAVTALERIADRLESADYIKLGAK